MTEQPIDGRAGAFEQGTAFSGPGADADLHQRIGLAKRGAAEKQPQRGADRHTTAVQHERSLPIAADPRTHPVSFNISAPRDNPPDGEVELLRHAVSTLSRRLDLLEAVIGNLDNEWKDAKRHGWTITKKADS